MRTLVPLVLLSLACRADPVGRLVALGGEEFHPPGVLLVVSAACPHCHRLARTLALQPSPPTIGLVVLEGESAAERFRTTTHLSARVFTLREDLRKWLKQMEIRGVPSLLALDPQGRVALRSAGGLSAREAEAFFRQAQALASPGGAKVDPPGVRP